MTQNHPSDRVRIAVVSTPRSGNTWLRGLLAHLTDSAEVAQHTPQEIPWEELPERVVLQIHWYPSSDFRRQLHEAGFKVVTITRHPLDLLMSILHFCRHEVQTDRWLDGAEGNERGLVGAAPQDRVVREYAAGPRFRQLLGVSDSWWDLADAAVRYEDLVAAPEETLCRLAGELGLDGDLDSRVSAAVESRRLETMRSTSGNHHYWQGTPGGWRRLLPGRTARRLSVPLADLLAARGYVVDPIPELDARLASQNWAAVEVRSGREHAPAVAGAGRSPALSLIRNLVLRDGRTVRPQLSGAAGAPRGR